MVIALIGAQRVGKSTLAKAASEQLGIPYLEMKTSAVFELMGYSPKCDYDFTTRLKIQNAILDNMKASYIATGSNFITDRSPIDALAYTLADVQRTNLTEQEQIDTIAYMDRCYELTNRHLAMLMLIPPGIPLIEEEGKAPANLTYMEHIHALCAGLLMNPKLEVWHFGLNRGVTDLQERIDSVKKMLNISGSRIGEQMRGAVLH